MAKEIEIKIDDEETSDDEIVVIDDEENDDAELEPIAEAIEQASSDEVEIAQINADRDISLAAIQADTEQARIDAEKEKETWRENQITELRERVEKLEANISTLGQSEKMAAEVVEEVTAEAMGQLSETQPEPSLIHQSMPDQTSEIQTEVSVENGDEKPVEVQVKAKRKFRRI